jgi:hypothetical protein
VLRRVAPCAAVIASVYRPGFLAAGGRRRRSAVVVAPGTRRDQRATGVPARESAHASLTSRGARTSTSITGCESDTTPPTDTVTADGVAAAAGVPASAAKTPGCLVSTWIVLPVRNHPSARPAGSAAVESAGTAVHAEPVQEAAVPVAGASRNETSSAPAKGLLAPLTVIATGAVPAAASAAVASVADTDAPDPANVEESHVTLVVAPLRPSVSVPVPEPELELELLELLDEPFADVVTVQLTVPG